MKIGERWVDNHDGTITQIKTHDYNPLLEKAEQVRHLAEINPDNLVKGENRLVGLIDMSMVNEWIKEAGIQWSDRQAVSEVIKKKMMSGEFDKLRVWDGRF